MLLFGLEIVIRLWRDEILLHFFGFEAFDFSLSLLNWVFHWVLRLQQLKSYVFGPTKKTPANWYCFLIRVIIKFENVIIPLSQRLFYVF